MQGVYGANPTSRSLSASASTANNQPASPEESASDDKTIDSPASSQISNQPVVAANLLPIPISEPSYAGPITVVLVFVGLIYYALYRIAGSGRQMAQTHPLEGGNEPRAEYQHPTRDPSGVPRPEETQTLARIKMELERVEELHSKVGQIEQTKEEIRQEANPQIETKTNSPSTPIQSHDKSDSRKPEEARHEMILPGSTRNDSVGPSITYNYDASGEKIGEARPESTVFSSVRTESSNEPIALHYDKDGKRIEESPRKTGFPGGIVRDAD